MMRRLGDPAKMPEWRDRRHGGCDEGKHSSVPGMEQQGLFIVGEVLVEGEAGRRDIGDERREPVDAVGDLADLGVHLVAYTALTWVYSRSSGPASTQFHRVVGIK